MEKGTAMDEQETKNYSIIGLGANQGKRRTRRSEEQWPAQYNRNNLKSINIVISPIIALAVFVF